MNSSNVLNKEIQRLINDENKDNKFVHGKKEFRLKDKVLHVKNNNSLGVMNGEVGYVVYLDGKEVHVDYDGKLIKKRNLSMPIIFMKI